MQYSIIFDYQDRIYFDQNPLSFLIKAEIYDNLRKVFFLLDERERFIINEIILKEKSISNTALLIDIDEQQAEEDLNNSLELLYQLFKNAYY